MMNMNGYGDMPIKDSRSKSQLQQDLFETQERLEKKEITLARCMQELQGIKIKLEASDSLNAKLLSKEIEKENAQAKIKKLENQLKELRKKLYAFQRQNKDLKQQVLSREQDESLPVAEKLQMVESRVDELESQSNKLKQKMKALENQNKKLWLEKEAGQKETKIDSRLADSHAKIEVLAAQNLSLNQQIGKLNRQITMLRQANESLKVNADMRDALKQYSNDHGVPAQTINEEVSTNEFSHEAVVPFDATENEVADIPQLAIRVEQAEESQMSQALQEIRFQQNDKSIPQRQPLRPWEPFAICTQINLPAAPDREKLEAFSSNYSIQIAAKESRSNNIIVLESVVGELKSSQSAYEDIIEMPKFSPGRYELYVVAIAPAARVDEQKKMEFIVAV